MNNTYTLTIGCLLFAAHGAAVSAFGQVQTLEPGAAAPAFDLPGVDGANHTLADYDDADILAVLFTCNHCPSAQGAESRVKKLVDDYRDQSFQLVAISPNAPQAVRLNELGYAVYGDSLDEMKKHATEQGFNFPYLYDGETQSVSKAYGVTATPHIFIFDRDRRLQYVGRVDDSRYGDPATIKTHDARDAIEALLAGRQVAQSRTRAHGCSTKWADKAKDVLAYNEAFEKKPVTLERIDVDGVKALARNKTDKLRLVNVWATWCGPCVAEMPDLVAVGRQFETRGFDLVTISVDAPARFDAAQTMLRRFHAAMPRLTEISVREEGRATNNYLFEGSTDELAEALDPAWPGSIPYTVLLAPGGDILYQHTGAVDPDELRRVIVKRLGRFYEP